MTKWHDLGERTPDDEPWLQVLIDAGYTIYRSDEGIVEIAKMGAPGWMTRLSDKAGTQALNAKRL